MTGEDELRKRMERDADLSLKLAEHLWDLYRPLRLAGEEYDVVGCDEVPGYDDEDMAVLLRRKSDGQVFEADIEVSIRPVLTEEELAERAAALKLPEAGNAA